MTTRELTDEQILQVLATFTETFNKIADLLETMVETNDAIVASLRRLADHYERKAE